MDYHSSNITKGENAKSKRGRVLYVTRHLVLFYISAKCHRNIPKGIRVTELTRNLFSNNTKGDNFKSNKARVVNLICDTSHPDLHFYQVSSKYSNGFSWIKLQSGQEVLSRRETSQKQSSGNLSNRCRTAVRQKFLAGQNKILQDRRLVCCQIISVFARNHSPFVRQTEIFCRIEWIFAGFVRQSCSFRKDCKNNMYPPPSPW